MISICTIILNWNRVNDTLECIKSLEKLNTKGINHEIVIVDNASSDNSVKIIKKQFPKYKVIENDKNLGFAEGNNVGIKHALKNKVDYILVLNNDTIVDSNLLSKLLKASKRYPKAAIFSPKIYFASGYEFHSKRYKSADLGKVLWYAGGKIDWDNVYGHNRGVDEVDKGQFETEEKIDFATGACMFLRASALLEDELFSKNYFMYLEDMDFSLKLQKKDFEVVYIPSAIIWHKVGRSSAIGAQLNDYYISRNRMLFGMSYAPLRSKIALVKQSYGLLMKGRKWEKQGIVDFYFGRFGKGSWK